MRNTAYSYLLLFTLLGGILACSQGEKNSRVTEDEPSIEQVLPEETGEVSVMTLTPSDFHHELMSNGKLSARKHADLRFETDEVVAAIYVKNGERVKKGQKLAELSIFRLANKTAQARETMEQARLELQDVLIGQGYLLEDSANIPVETLRLAYIKSGYKQALTQYELARYEEEHATLTAPFDGTVANLFTQPFNRASAAETFCTLIDPQSLEAAFTVLENELPLIRLGDPVEVTPFAASGTTTSGSISEINPLVDKEGMVQVKAAVRNGGQLFEGMNVKVSIRRSLGKQLVVPKTAVVLRSGKQVIFTLVQGKAYWNYVRTGLENADSYTVVEGLKAGDQVITSGNINLAHESPVKVIVP